MNLRKILLALGAAVVAVAALGAGLLVFAHVVPWPSPYPRAETGDRRIAELPLSETPAAGRGGAMVVLYSGDGGWVRIDQEVADDVAKAGVPVVGYDSLRYFIQRRTPREAAAALTAVLRHYTVAWDRPQIILAGYSMGADALPAIIPLLPPDLRARIRLVALISAGPAGDLDFKPQDWLGYRHPTGFQIAPLLAQEKDLPTVCIYGDHDARSACPALALDGVRLVRLHGDHHFDKTYAPISQAILQAAGVRG